MQAILDAQENERKNIAREVHDNLGPILSISAMQADMLSAKIAGSEEAKLLNNIKAQLQEAVYVCRHVSHQLTPLLHPGITFDEMVNGYIEQISNAGKLKITAQINTRHVKMHEQKATSLCRVLTELLHNTLKHAEATNAVINIFPKDDSLQFDYHDNGIGLTPGQKVKGIGLNNIQFRISLLNGTISIPESPNQQGFCMNIKIPLSSLQ